MTAKAANDDATALNYVKENAESTLVSKDGVDISYDLNSWGTGYWVGYKLTNNSKFALKDWTVKLSKEQVNIDSSWCVNIETTDDEYILTPLSWNTNVASGATSKYGTFSSAGTVAQGDTGHATTITGLANVTLSAGGATGAKVQSSSTTATRRDVGIQGTNVANGSNVVAILENNVNTILSTQGTSSSSSRTASGQPNTNWEENTQKGIGGDCGWSGNNFLLKAGGIGFVRIQTSD